MSRLIDFLFSTQLYDDSVDRLHRRYSVLMLVSAALLVGFIQLFGRPVTCWTPAQFTDQHVDYGDSICWNSGTHYLPATSVLPAYVGLSGNNTPHPESLPSSNKFTGQNLSYIKWVPFVLVFQALLVFVPCLAWRFFSSLSGMNVAAVLDAARVCSRPPDPVSRQQALRYLVNRMDRFSRGNNSMCPVLDGFILIIIYPIFKVIYVISAISQLFLINSFVFADHRLSRLSVVDRLARGVDWPYTERFPLITLCEFEIRHQSRLHTYVLQCNVAINDVNQKLFLFFWFWFLVLAVVTAVSLAFWLFRVFYWPGQVRYVRNLIWTKDSSQKEMSGLDEFARRYLGYDGMFVVRLIGNNVGEVVAAEVLNELWKSRSQQIGPAGVLHGETGVEMQERGDPTEVV